MLHKLRKKGVLNVSVEPLKKHIGRLCHITTLLEKKVTGEIISIEGNWVAVKTKRNTEYINAEFIERFFVNN